MKFKKLLIIILCISFLGGCRVFRIDIDDMEENTTNTPVDFEVAEDPKEIKPSASINLNDEASIREYMIGEWFYKIDYISNMVCMMNIDEELNIDLVFKDSFSEKVKGEYSGTINLDRMYPEETELPQAPNLISIDLKDTDYPGGDYFFLHRTIYDEKTVMSLFFAGNGNGIMDKVADVEFGYVPEEIIFEKVGGEKSELLPRKNDEFHAVLWGVGEDGRSLWLDDVIWTPKEEDFFEDLYPKRMTMYENEVKESVLYQVAEDRLEEIIDDNLFIGEAFVIKTDEEGNIIYFSMEGNPWYSEKGQQILNKQYSLAR